MKQLVSTGRHQMWRLDGQAMPRFSAQRRRAVYRSTRSPIAMTVVPVVPVMVMVIPVMMVAMVMVTVTVVVAMIPAVHLFHDAGRIGGSSTNHRQRSCLHRECAHSQQNGADEARYDWLTGHFCFL